jgi:hypothetical protein
MRNDFIDYAPGVPPNSVWVKRHCSKKPSWTTEAMGALVVVDVDPPGETEPVFTPGAISPRDSFGVGISVAKMCPVPT